jgi:signal transduction histidine kinase
MVETGIVALRAPRQLVPAMVLDAVLGTAIVAAVLVVVVTGGPEAKGRPLTWSDGVFAGAVAGLILVRRRWPLPVLVVSGVLAVLAYAWIGELAGGFVATAVVAMYTVAAHTSRATAWQAGAVTALALYGGIVAWSGHGWFGPVSVVAWIGMATAVGDATRTRREYVAAVEERARRAEQTRDEEARRRVAEERVRIARELHDVVAHNIAVINVHAGLAEHSVRTRPEKAEVSLTHVQQAARTVLDELATILTVLRQTGDPELPTEPVRGLSQLGELLDSMASAGLRARHQQTGAARALPPVVDWAAYRIIQEGLTNAHKHGAPGTAELRVEYRPDAVGIDITNPVTARPKRSGSTGHGLTGMRERAIAIGGTFTAGPTAAGGFHVQAVLPTAPQPEGAP